jgi:tetratricopeptide (TPR) repeat protein
VLRNFRRHSFLGRFAKILTKPADPATFLRAEDIKSGSSQPGYAEVSSVVDALARPNSVSYTDSMLWGKQKSAGFSRKQEDAFIQVVVRGWELFDLGHYEAARQEFHKAADGGWPGAWMGIAGSFLEEKNVRDAIAAYEKAIETSGDIYLRFAANSIVGLVPLYRFQLSEHAKSGEIDFDLVQKTVRRSLELLTWVEGLHGRVDIDLIVTAKELLAEFYIQYSADGEIGRPHQGRWVECKYFVVRHGNPEQSQAAQELITTMVEYWQGEGELPIMLRLSHEGMEAISALGLGATGSK